MSGSARAHSAMNQKIRQVFGVVIAIRDLDFPALRAECEVRTASLKALGWSDASGPKADLELIEILERALAEIDRNTHGAEMPS